MVFLLECSCEGCGMKNFYVSPFFFFQPAKASLPDIQVKSRTCVDHVYILHVTRTIVTQPSVSAKHLSALLVTDGYSTQLSWQALV